MWVLANVNTDLDVFLRPICSSYLDVKLKISKKDDKKEFGHVQSLSMGDADSNQFMRLRNQLIVAAENFVREENLPPVPIPIISKHMDEQLK